MDFSLLDPKEVTPCSFYWDRYHGSAAPLQHPASNYEHAIAPSPYCKDGHHSDYIIMLPRQPGQILMLVLVIHWMSRNWNCPLAPSSSHSACKSSKIVRICRRCGMVLAVPFGWEQWWAQVSETATFWWVLLIKVVVGKVKDKVWGSISACPESWPQSFEVAAATALLCQQVVHDFVTLS